ncbi:MAG: A24 family peptidase [Actinomycetota bacterium]|nr:A24 family peptidase [Actinomycetota bacterium]
MDHLRLISLWLFALAAACWDLSQRRVPNRLILAAATGGMALNACYGWSAFVRGLIGFTLGLIILLPFFVLHMVGGGDVKSLAVVGLFTGPHLLWPCFILGAAAGGLSALILLAARGLRGTGNSEVEGREGRPREIAARSLPYAGILSICAALSYSILA